MWDTTRTHPRGLGKSTLVTPALAAATWSRPAVRLQDGLCFRLQIGIGSSPNLALHLLLEKR